MSLSKKQYDKAFAKNEERDWDGKVVCDQNDDGIHLTDHRAFNNAVCACGARRFVDDSDPRP